MKSAVLVIDVQSIIFDSEPKLFEGDQVVDRINTLTGRARSQDIPVIFIQHEHPNSVIAYESEGWQLQRNLQVEPTDKFVRKTTPDSFLRTDLESLLQQNEIEHLIVCGYATEFCIDSTVRKAAGLGYSIELVADAHSTHDKEHATGEQIRRHHNATLPNLTSFGVKITAVPTNQLLLED